MILDSSILLVFTVLMVHSSTARIHKDINNDLPSICATYFNFTNRNQSNTFYGVANQEGAFEMISDLGYRFDPQGRIAIGKESFTFTAIGTNETEFDGCCDEYSMLTVNKTTGDYAISTIATKRYRPGSEQCGKYGCGIMSFSRLNDDKHMIVWMQPQISPAPPMPTRSIENNEGLSLGNFDVRTGEITPIRPFKINIDNTSLSTPMDSGMASYDSINQRFWFSCNPRGDIDHEGVCWYPATKSNEQSDVSVFEFTDKNYTINSILFDNQF